MNWQNLTKIPPLCPTCGSPLEYIERSSRWICSDVMGCDFAIGKDKFLELTNKMVDDLEERYSGDCEICGKRINPRYRLCRNCDN